MDQKNFKFIVMVIFAIFLGVIVYRGSVQLNILKDIQAKQVQLINDQQKDSKAPLDTLINLASTQNELKTRVANLELLFKTAQLGNQRAPSPTAPQAPTRPSDEYTKIYSIPIDHSKIKGNKNAPVTIVEFTDMQCPYCSRFHFPLQEVIKAYPKAVKIVLKNFPLSFHKQARSAAKVALAAGEQGKYWEMVDLLLKNQKQFSEEKYVELAKELGLDMTKFEDDYKNKDAEWEKILTADTELGRKVGVRGTPTFFINGKKTRARDLAAYKSEIDAILKKMNN